MKNISKNLGLATILALSSLGCLAQAQITSSDVTNFWVMFDSLNQQSKPNEQVKVVQRLYIDKASDALSTLLQIDSLTATTYVNIIQRRPQRWTSIRQKTLALTRPGSSIDSIYYTYQTLYPTFHPPVISFVIGCFGRGGTTTKKLILVGTEVLADDTTQSAEGLKKSITYMVAHELGHVQQDYVNEVNNEEEYKHLDLLGWAIMEGSCDFVAEQVLGCSPALRYIAYGQQHERAIWKQFQRQMYGYKIDDWLYNGGSARMVPADLGYFIGYAICKSYYNHAANKRKAIRDILSINYNQNEHHRFFKKAKYMP